MPACGKSSLGVLLAKSINFSFLDSDLVIQNQTGKLLKELISEQGIDGFNRLEDRINAGIHVNRTVIATGGSAVYGANAMKHFRETGTILYLKTSLSETARRLGDLDERGVVHRPGQTLEDLYNERTALYERYQDLTLEEPDGAWDVSSLLKRCLELLKKNDFL